VRALINALVGLILHAHRESHCRGGESEDVRKTGCLTAEGSEWLHALLRIPEPDSENVRLKTQIVSPRTGSLNFPCSLYKIT
jgi:hypothetical protein